MFEPPFCPHLECPTHHSPGDNFYTLCGTYSPKCRTAPVQRFRCRNCQRTFSVQTFRADYYDRKPELNAPVMALLASGVGFRQTARLVGLARSSLEAKARKMSCEARDVDAHLRQRSGALKRANTVSVHFDELETFEGSRASRPVTIALAIESRTRFIFGAISGAIRAKGKMTERRREQIKRDEDRFGPRASESETVCRASLGVVEDMVGPSTRIELFTDEKSSYGPIARSVFRGRDVQHSQTSSVLPRGTLNPLFPINHEEACLRDKIGRLRRESWLVSKLRKYLNLHLAAYAAVRNYVRPRFNRDTLTPAQLLGISPFRLSLDEILGWRQAFGIRSLCPVRNPGALGYELRRVAPSD